VYSIAVRPDGTITYIYDDSLQFMKHLADAGDVKIKRVSCVEPDADGLWWADMSPVGGPSRGPYQLRAQALLAERVWLRKNLNL